MIWSYILDYENAANPFAFRKTSIIEWKKKAFTFVKENDSVLKQANAIKNHGLKAKDALHIACTIEAECGYFLTTDDQIINKSNVIDAIEIMNPVELLKAIEE